LSTHKSDQQLAIETAQHDNAPTAQAEPAMTILTHWADKITLPAKAKARLIGLLASQGFDNPGLARLRYGAGLHAELVSIWGNATQQAEGADDLINAFEAVH
jgi:hypothetical protein